MKKLNMENLLKARNFRPLLKKALLIEAHRIYGLKPGRNESRDFELRRNLAIDVASNVNIYVDKFADNLVLSATIGKFIEIEEKTEKVKTQKVVNHRWENVEIDAKYYLAKYKGKDTVEKDLTKEILNLWDLLAGV